MLRSQEDVSTGAVSCPRLVEQALFRARFLAPCPLGVGSAVLETGCLVTSAEHERDTFRRMSSNGHHIEVTERLQKVLLQWFSNFHEPWLPSKFTWRILNISWHLG